MWFRGFGMKRKGAKFCALTIFTPWGRKILRPVPFYLK